MPLMTPFYLDAHEPGAFIGRIRRRLAEDEPLRERIRAGGLATVRKLDPARFDEAVEEALTRAAAATLS